MFYLHMCPSPILIVNLLCDLWYLISEKLFVLLILLVLFVKLFLFCFWLLVTCFLFLFLSLRLSWGLLLLVVEFNVCGQSQNIVDNVGGMILIYLINVLFEEYFLFWSISLLIWWRLNSFGLWLKNHSLEKLCL